MMRHLLSCADLDEAQALSILDLAVEMQQVQSRPVKKLPALRGPRLHHVERGTQGKPGMDDEEANP